MIVLLDPCAVGRPVLDRVVFLPGYGVRPLSDTVCRAQTTRKKSGSASDVLG